MSFITSSEFKHIFRPRLAASLFVICYRGFSLGGQSNMPNSVQRSGFGGPICTTGVTQITNNGAAKWGLSYHANSMLITKLKSLTQGFQTIGRFLITNQGSPSSQESLIVKPPTYCGVHNVKYHRLHNLKSCLHAHQLSFPSSVEITDLSLSVLGEPSKFSCLSSLSLIRFPP
jgi:hypothetical protein